MATKPVNKAFAHITIGCGAGAITLTRYDVNAVLVELIKQVGYDEASRWLREARQ